MTGGSGMLLSHNNFIIIAPPDTIIWFVYKIYKKRTRDIHTEAITTQYNYVSPPNKVFLYRFAFGQRKQLMKATSLKAHYANFYTIKLFFLFKK